MKKNFDICVFGGCGWDMTFIQRADGSYNITPDKELPGGKGANQAVAAARAGERVTVVSVVGRDETGEKIISNLMNNNIDTRNISVRNDIKSGLTKVYVGLNKDNHMQRISDSVAGFNADMVDKYGDVLKNSRLVVAQCKVEKDVTVKLIRFCRDNNIDLVLTPCTPERFNVNNPEDYELLKSVKYITANAREAAIITNTFSPYEAVDVLPNMIVTSGKFGAFYKLEDVIKNTYIPDVREVGDSTGCGDTFCGNFCSSILDGASFEKSVERGVVAATIKLAHEGAQPGMPAKEELDAQMGVTKVLTSAYFFEDNKQSDKNL